MSIPKEIASVWLLAVLWCAIGKANEGERVLFEFDKPKVDEAWLNVNDNVMGGVSEAKFRITDDKTLEFYGTLSLENNGGFASVRCRATKLDLSTFEAVAFKVRGDGRTYWFNINVPSLLPAFSYRATFPTKAGEWQEIKIPLKDFAPRLSGRRCPVRSIPRRCRPSVSYWQTRRWGRSSLRLRGSRECRSQRSSPAPSTLVLKHYVREA